MSRYFLKPTHSSDSPSVSKNRSQDNNVAVHHTNICLTVTMHCCISQMQEYPGVRLSLVAWLKSRYANIPVGEHTVEVGT